MKKRLGLDIGTNSLGWCLLEIDENNPDDLDGRIIKSGSRIFSDGRDTKTFSSLKADRRLARQASRRRDRYLRRRESLMKALVHHGLMPENITQRKALEDLDPYEIRDRALAEQIDPHELGRAIFHLNQRRGFKSNRKTADNEAGVVKSSIAALEQKLSETGSKTIGSFLAGRHAKGETVRARRLGNKTSDLYELYPNRAMYEKEFDLIWQAQAEYDHDFYTDEKRDEIKRIIFFQRKLKPQKKGKCSFFPDKDRMARALPSFQRFRILQEINNLEWIDRWGRAHPVRMNRALRDALVRELEQKKELKFASMAKTMKKMGIVEYDVTFNLQSEKRVKLDGNVVSAEMRHKDRIGSEWDNWDHARQDDLIALLIDDLIEDTDAADILITEFGIPATEGDRIQKILDARLPSGYGSLSKEAVDILIPIMADQGLQYWEAIEEAGLGKHNLYDPNRPLGARLEYYGKVLQGDVLPGSGKEEDRHNDVRFYGEIPNPTVHIALNQIRQVVNELIRIYGKPDEIVIELARDLPAGAEGRQETVRHQTKNQQENDSIREILENPDMNVEINRANIQRFKLWKELATDPTDQQCVFCGKVIPMGELFTSAFEIEHLLPFSKTLDDGMANKTVSCRQCNRDKGNRSPFEAFGSDEARWSGIITRSKNLPKPKQWRFQPDAMEKHAKEGGFLARQINDTRYISRYTRKYLASVVPENKVWVVTGRLTALLRHHWGLNSVLRGDNAPEEEQQRKLRDDHRHHAIDAVVIAMCSRSMVQRISTAAGRTESLNIEKLFAERGDIDPWPGFRADVMDEMEKMIVSHRPRKKKQGPLHNDTAYGFVSGAEDKVVHRVTVDNITDAKKLALVRDDYIRNTLQEVTLGLSGTEFKEAVLDWCANQKEPVQSLRIVETINLVPIKRNKTGAVYKGYKPDGNSWMDVYPDSKGKWQGEVVSRFNANQPDFIPQWRKENPALKRIMQIRINDCLKLEIAGQEIIVRVQRLSKGIVTLAPLNEANVDARNRDNDDPFNFIYKAPSALQKARARKVHISPTGLVREEP